MYTIDFVNEEKYVRRVGDLCGEYYVPFALPGRYKCNVEDIENVLHMWMSKSSKIKDKEGKDGENGLLLFASIFRETNFSLILSKSRYEQNVCVWKILWCAWKYIFKQTFEKDDNKYMQKYEADIIRFQAGCIYLLFLLYYSQHVEENNFPYPLYMSPRIMNLCLDVTEECERMCVYNDLRNILNFMVDSNSIILSCNDGFDGDFQDRYGAPLYIDKGKLGVENCAEINDVDLPSYFAHFQAEMKDLCELCDKQRRKGTLSNTSAHSLRAKFELVRRALMEDDLV
ncbi:hypothetical protein AK88_02050 [Plasmodium fragile]|uniref:Uncharacterized protein n=1 Tax=Plasmodium fragile TaxID=5857 RepID=A0A0D9QML0_PLAFR|nr:uncharacterized protein AK88_02050 [Plasmodium fragile]KJP88269.1 hypothetical protein AK88_02050 [Plasmodium fragile]